MLLFQPAVAFVCVVEWVCLMKENKGMKQSNKARMGAGWVNCFLQWALVSFLWVVGYRLRGSQATSQRKRRAAPNTSLPLYSFFSLPVKPTKPSINARRAVDWLVLARFFFFSLLSEFVLLFLFGWLWLLSSNARKQTHSSLSLIKERQQQSMKKE